MAASLPCRLAVWLELSGLLTLLLLQALALLQSMILLLPLQHDCLVDREEENEVYYKIARHYLWALTNVFDGPEDYQACAQWDAKSQRKESIGICGD